MKPEQFYCDIVESTVHEIIKSNRFSLNPILKQKKRKLWALSTAQLADLEPLLRMK